MLRFEEKKNMEKLTKKKISLKISLVLGRIQIIN